MYVRAYFVLSQPEAYILNTFYPNLWLQIIDTLEAAHANDPEAQAQVCRFVADIGRGKAMVNQKAWAQEHEVCIF